MVRNIGIQAKQPEKECNDDKCPWHGTLPVRGRVLQGEVINDKAPKTVSVRWDYVQFIPKYERFERRHSSVHAYKPDCIEVKTGDIVRIAECRPLSKTKAFVVIERVK